MNLNIALELSDHFERQIPLEQGLYASLDSIVLIIVVSYPLVVSCFQQCYIGIVNY